MNIKTETVKRRKSIKKHVLLYKYLATFTFGAYKKIEDDFFEYVSELLENKLYVQAPFNVTEWMLIELCNTKRYEKWLEDEGVLVKYPLNVVLSLSTSDFDFIKSQRVKYMKKREISNEIPVLKRYCYAA